MKTCWWAIAGLALFGAAPAAAQTQLPNTGPVEHREARTSFPERVDEYRRVSAVAYNPEGTDLSAAYRVQGADGPLLITVYIYPAALHEVQPAGDVAACRRHFGATADAVTGANTTARRRPQSEPLAAPPVRRDLSHRAVFDVTRHANWSGPFVSQLDVYCYVGGTWIVKYRTTSTPGLDPAKAVETFVRSGPWPGRVMPDSVAGNGAAPPDTRAAR